jgi:hypothetical protein
MIILPGFGSKIEGTAQLFAEQNTALPVVVDEMAARIGYVGEEAGDEVESLEGLGLLAVVAGLGQVRGGL